MVLGGAFFNGFSVVVAFFFEVVQPLTACLGLFFWGEGAGCICYSMLALGNLKLDNAACVNMTY